MSWMILKVVLPYQTFLYKENVKRIVVETVGGSFGMLPHRMDAAAVLVQGILEFETSEEEIHYLAISEGILVKTGLQVSVSVRTAIGGADLGKLQEQIETNARRDTTKEQAIKKSLAKLESSFLRGLEKFNKS